MSELRYYAVYFRLDEAVEHFLFERIIKTWDSLQKKSTQKLQFVANRSVVGETEYVL